MRPLRWACGGAALSEGGGPDQERGQEGLCSGCASCLMVPL